jgi:hypothetical protein
VNEAENKTVLPSRFAALRFACQCFGVNMPELQRMLVIMRRREKDPDGYFPRKLNRVMLNDAEDGKGEWCEALEKVAYEALYDRVRRQRGKPLFGSAGDLAERLAFALLRLYEKILPGLNTDGVPRGEVLWLLTTEVFVPTVFAELALNWRDGLGTEFQVETCWYLPARKKGEWWGPVRTILHLWLRASGFRNAHDLKKELNSDSARRSADRWIRGGFVPTIDALHSLVNRFGKNVGWLGARDTWKTRFTLACGVEHLCAAMDDRFGTRHPNCSRKMSSMIRRVRKDHVAVDDGRALADSQAFFAARLLQRRLVDDGKWSSKVTRFVPERAGRTFGKRASEKTIDKYRRAIQWKMNPGNWFLRLIEREVVAGGYQDIAGLGVRELNRILDGKRGRRAHARQP